MTVNGIDIAHYQPNNYSTRGLDFVFVKATEGVSYVSPSHDAQVAHGRSNGLVVGHYHFQRPGSPTAQAKYFLTHAKPRAGDMLACDWEDPAVPEADKNAFIRAVQKASPGLRVGLYANLEFWLDRDKSSFCGHFLWVADPSAAKGHPRVQHPWLFHQYSEAGGLDHDAGNFADRTALQRWAAGIEENDMAISRADAEVIAHAVASYSHGDKPDVHQTWQTAAEQATAAAKGVKALVATTGQVTLTETQLNQLADRLTASPALAAAIAEQVVTKLATRLKS